MTEPGWDANGPEALLDAMRQLVDRQRIEDTLYRYASSIDVKDFATLRSIFAEDVVAVYGDRDPIVGVDALCEWIAGHTHDRAWQHHLLNVYHVDIDGDTARATTYHTSHQTTDDDPDTVIVIVARYFDELRREPHDRWVITRKEMQVGWRERRARA
jgi:ketosteroid isomerase-like protein